MSVLYPLIQALVLFAVAPRCPVLPAWHVRVCTIAAAPGVLQEYRDIIKLLGRQSIAPADSSWVFRLTPFVMVGVMLTIAHCVAGSDRWLAAATTGRSDHLNLPVRHRPFLLLYRGTGYR